MKYLVILDWYTELDVHEFPTVRQAAQYVRGCKAIPKENLRSIRIVWACHIKEVRGE